MKKYQFIFRKGKLLLSHNTDSYSVPYDEQFVMTPAEGTIIHPLGTIEGVECIGYCTSSEQTSTLEEKGLRESYDLIPLQFYRMAGKASQLIYWDCNNRFCPVCGTLLIQSDRICKKCPSCGKEVYPTISPSIIVLIRKGDSILMVHSLTFAGKYKGLVAGFAEPGENLEECVAREVMEETGLTIKNLKYFGSQSWPYPSGLIAGFTADYESGELRMQEDELDSLDFYHIDSLPEIPKKLSMARKLIDNWLEEHGKTV